jgi:hypothetical protein
MLSQHHTQTIQIMTDQQVPEKRTAPKTSSNINNLIAAANKDDRFKLLEDDCSQAANLDNPIHRVFQWLHTPALRTRANEDHQQYNQDPSF